MTNKLCFAFLGFLGLLVSTIGAETNVEMEQGIFEKESILAGERRAQAENHYETGIMLYRQQQYEKAGKFFRKAVQLNPDDQDAKNYLIRVQSVLGVRGATVKAQSEWLEQNLVVRRQEQWAELNKRLELADNAYLQFTEDTSDLFFQKVTGERSTLLYDELGKLEEVEDLYENALELIKTMDVSEDQRRARGKIMNRIAEIRTRATALRAEVESVKRLESKRRMISERVEDEKYLKNKIRNILEAAEAELAREDYDKCMSLCDDILVVEPTNKAAKTLRRKALELRHRKVASRTTFERKKEMTRRLLKIKEAFVPYTSSVVYPDDWQKISTRQQKQLNEGGSPAWKRRLDAVLDRYVSYSCPGLPLTEVLAQLSELSGLNIVLSPKVLQERDETELELKEFNYGHMKLRHILQWVCREVDLTFTLKFDVVYVTNKTTATDETVIQIYDIQDLLQARQNFSAPSLEDGWSSSEGGIEIDAVDVEEVEPITADVLLEMIESSIAGNWGEDEAVILRALETGALLVKNTQDVQYQIADLIRTLRRTSSLQIEVEARLLTVEKGFFRDIGFDWTGLDTAEPLSSGPTPGFFDRSNDKYDISGAIVNGLAAQNGLSGIGFFLEHSILGSFQAKVLLKAVENDDDLTQLIAPKMVLVNNILGYIRLGRTQNLITSYEIGSSEDGGGGGIQPVITSIDEGQLLAVTATVSSDRKYITLRLNPDFQEVTVPRTAILSGTQRATSAAGTTEATYTLPIDLPTVVKQKVRTTAVIPDDGVLILGGVSTSREEAQDKGVPIISKVPVFGRLFRSDHRSDSSTDSMFLVHGKIIMFDELEANL